MPSYEASASTITDALKNSQSAVFTDSTINQILKLAIDGRDVSVIQQSPPDQSGHVTVDTGTKVVFVSTSDITQTTVTPPANTPVVIFQGKGGVVATLNDGVTTPSTDTTHPDRVVVGTAGNDKIIVADAKNTQVILGTGNSTVQTGHGVDTVQAGLGNSTIIGGGGDYAVVKLGGSATNYTVSVNDGHAIVSDKTSHNVTDITKIQYVQLDNGNALVFAKDSVEAAVATLYHTAFGRDADAGGLNYWFDLGRAGVSLKQIADGFTHTSEFAAKAALSNTDFVQSLYLNTFGRAGEAAGVQFWTDALAHGSTRADLITQFSQIAAQNIDHTQHTETQIIGSVTIVTGII